MKKAGLTVVPVDAKTKELWRRRPKAPMRKVRGEVVPRRRLRRGPQVPRRVPQTARDSRSGAKEVNILSHVFKRTEQAILVATLGLATILPLIDAIGRPLGGFHIPANADYVQQLTLWLAFVGGIAATSQAKHLTLSTAEFFDEGAGAPPLAAASPTRWRPPWSASWPTPAPRS